MERQPTEEIVTRRLATATGTQSVKLTVTADFETVAGLSTSDVANAFERAFLEAASDPDTSIDVDEVTVTSRGADDAEIYAEAASLYERLYASGARCPPGTAPATETPTSLSDCKCSAGYKLRCPTCVSQDPALGPDCIACGLGQYKAMLGNHSECTPCPVPFETTRELGSTHVRLCVCREG
ncbi:hypothetical protein Pmar_PMAR028596 [Perkinsus marinus ATCC 50983]|uniref:Tyrosine-protein kinase ephrin type A/B receptor-like domain-containing protein n=1 Tax=Perkinsus marinus (strain ATCC 50983 / TXsc) TaxID=423536 RepID=C5LN01_PERM5|nr:hypothetical protein Pmar_PMAR028596 [Perkinsus marinus ATCC 50983]EER01892.1 hypothetical protein Pmar_PMAR028596 [Perkinsus marinus ATCC 50983]|eukprot:XP_002769174.1 hypothetical protein Pmar_PMAR028596 [Perkinsus marinus ATCC 50983]